MFICNHCSAGIQVPSSIPSTIFSGTRDVPAYLLSPDGEKTCLKILYILSHMHPDIHFAPVVPPLASLCLHFMEENLCYACLSALMDSRRSMLDQSQRAYAVMAKTFQDSLKSYFVSWMLKYLPLYHSKSDTCEYITMYVKNK